MDTLDSNRHYSPPAACDTVDHGASPQRISALAADAYQFNQTLKANESDGTGKGNFGAAMEASHKFYDELTQLPIGERKALLQLAQDINQQEQKGDPAMPTIDQTMRPDGFLEQLTINYPEPFYPDAASRHEHAKGEKATHYTPEQFVYQGNPMCAELPQALSASITSGGARGAFILHPVEIRE